jgi:hypothetical protein
MDDEIKDLIPQMNVSLPVEAQEKEQCLVGDEELLGIYGEIIKNLRDDRTQIDECFVEFKEMVINGGDASTSSKEALVTLRRMARGHAGASLGESASWEILANFRDQIALRA